MLDLVLRKMRGASRPGGRRHTGVTPVEVVSHRGRIGLRPAGAAGPAAAAARATLPGIGDLAPFAIGAPLLAVVVVATAAFMAVFSTTFEAATRAIPEGSLTAPRSDAARALAIERDRRREALVDFDRHIAGAADNPALQETWRDLKRREVAAVRLLDEHLGGTRRPHPPQGAAGHTP